jgi:hypothetical protein
MWTQVSNGLVRKGPTGRVKLSSHEVGRVDVRVARDPIRPPTRIGFGSGERASNRTGELSIDGGWRRPEVGMVPNMYPKGVGADRDSGGVKPGHCR